MTTDSPWALDRWDAAIVSTIADLCTGTAVVRTSEAIRALHGEHGNDPPWWLTRIGRLAGTWWLPLPLIAPVGNLGSPDIDAADPDFTEVGLNAAGRLVASDIDSYPIGLINGGDTTPAFDPRRVLSAVAASAAADLADGELVDQVGGPVAPGGGTVSGDFELLAAGAPVPVTYRSRFSYHGTDLTIDALPPGVGADHALRALLDRRWRTLVEDADNHSTGHLTRLSVHLADGVTGEEAARQLDAAAPFTVVRQVHLDLPLVEMIRRCAAHPGAGGAVLQLLNALGE